MPILTNNPKFRFLVFTGTVWIALLNLRRESTHNQTPTYVKSAASPRTKDNTDPENSHDTMRSNTTSQMWSCHLSVDACWLCECVLAHRNSAMACKTLIPCLHGCSASCVFTSKWRFKSGFSLPLMSVKTHPEYVSKCMSLMCGKDMMSERVLFYLF